MNYKYKSVLFDMDGTVLDTLDDLCDAVNYILNKYGYPQISKSECAQNLGNGARILLEKSVPNGLVSEQMLQEYLEYYNENCNIKTKPYSGIYELMGTLKEAGIRMAIISNKPDSATKELAQQLFGDYIEFAVGESKLIKRKPNPDAVLDAINHFGIPKEDCVYIGDTEVDIQTGINAGIDVIAVLWGFRSEQQLINSGAKILVNDCEELLEKLT